MVSVKKNLNRFNRIVTTLLALVGFHATWSELCHKWLFMAVDIRRDCEAQPRLRTVANLARVLSYIDYRSSTTVRSFERLLSGVCSLRSGISICVSVR